MTWFDCQRFARELMDMARRQVNNMFNLDVVRVSGQYTLKAHIATVIEKYGIDAIIDVGANEGDFGSLMRGIGFKGEIFSFEPVAEAFGILASRAINDDKWHAYDFALGSEAGVSQINVSRFSQFSSILSANEYGNSWENMQVEHQQAIVIKTLDQCFSEGIIHGGKRYLLKMDTQGYDLEVFKGAKDSLSSVCCMLSELSLIPLYEGMPNYLESLAIYAGEGFSASGFYPITRHQNLALNEVDCMFVRGKTLDGS